MLDCDLMSTWRLTIEYKGTRYQGWQEQASGRTIQGELKKAAKDYFGEEIDLGGSGRTDAGVHALAQVAHLRATKKRPPEQIQLALNDRLPMDIHISKVEPSSEKFHARLSALSRYYLYQISTRRTALAKNYVWWVKEPLHLELMAACSRLFEGRHDFRSFTERPREQGSTLVVIEEIRLLQVEDLILIRLGASHFLWKMVRRLVGVLAQVGAEKIKMDRVEDFLKSHSTEVGQWTAPASGLFLERVVYPGDSPPKLFRPVVAVFSTKE
ncbi:MAG: tRNA pseudouridine(38-40) synthase TruA [Acidobacteria bacterium]|nr:MAG: tRNA pseudouridine(38-40) synthase TruA [Acidobacteriota bacterium]